MTCRLTQFIRLPGPIPDQCSLFRRRKKSVICGKLAICVGVLLVGALQAFAQTRINVSITATSVPKPLPNQTCKNYDPNQGGFDSVCPSGETQLGSNCECINIQDARVSGNLWGSAQLLITEDLGSPTVTPEQNCVPFYGVIYITSGANTDSAAATKLDVVGLDCDPLATSAAESFRGSFGPNLPMSLTKTSHPSISMTDFGTLKGTVNANGVLRMKLKSPRTSEIGEDTASNPDAKESRRTGCNNPGCRDIDPGNSACDGVNSRTPDAWDPAHGASGNLGSDAIGRGDYDSRDTNPGSPGYGGIDPGNSDPGDSDSDSTRSGHSGSGRIRTDVPAAVAATAVSRLRPQRRQ